jgi:hypothetical protein
MFVFTYLPKLAVLALLNGPLAAVTTILLTLSESSTLISIISRTFLLQDALVDTFDGVLVARNQTAVVSEGRQLRAGNFNDPIGKLGKLLKSPFEKFSPKALVRYVMYLPLNFIPVVGTVMFVLLQGRTRGGSVHTRVHLILRLPRSVINGLALVLPAQEMVEFEERGLVEGEYRCIYGVSLPATCSSRIMLSCYRFGTVATLLELIPVASILFSFTNTGRLHLAPCVRVS